MTTLSENILRLRSEGKSYNTIKDELGCSKGSVSYHLGAGQKDKARASLQVRRVAIRDYLNEVKSEAVCADCGIDYPFWVMDFDHLGDKKFGISSFSETTATLSRVQEEVSKCDVVCSNCHRHRSQVRLGLTQ